MAYDSSGNFYIGINTTADSWVDEYPPGSTTVSRHITDGIHHPGSMVADPDGNLYVANIGVLGKNVVRYKSGETSPDETIEKGIGNPSDLVFYSHLLWFADDVKNLVRAYDGTRSKYEISSDLHGPTALSETGGNLYVLNIPFIGTDYVREYGILNGGPPVFARTIPARLHFIKAIATDTNENLYLAEWNADSTKFEVSKYDRNGEHLFSAGSVTKPVSIVASPSTFYVAEGVTSGNVLLYKDLSGNLIGTIKTPCADNTPTKLAIMEALP